jgi:hypothetical protein
LGRFLNGLQESAWLCRALFHWLRLGYYQAALNHVGHAHPDSTLLTLRAAESALVVDTFLRGKA